jgi:hypothetical protein
MIGAAFVNPCSTLKSSQVMVTMFVESAHDSKKGDIDSASSGEHLFSSNELCL